MNSQGNNESARWHVPIRFPARHKKAKVKKKTNERENWYRYELGSLCCCPTWRRYIEFRLASIYRVLIISRVNCKKKSLHIYYLSYYTVLTWFFLSIPYIVRLADKFFVLTFFKITSRFRGKVVILVLKQAASAAKHWNFWIIGRTVCTGQQVSWFVILLFYSLIHRVWSPEWSRVDGVFLLTIPPLLPPLLPCKSLGLKIFW